MELFSSYVPEAAKISTFINSPLVEQVADFYVGSTLISNDQRERWNYNQNNGS